MADRTISYLFRGDFRNFTAGLTAASRGVQDFGGRLTALDRDGERMRRGLSTVGDAAGKIGFAAAAGLGVVIAVTAKFESAMSRVSAATNASAGDLDKLRKAAIQAGADTVFSASGAADGITELGKAGLSTSDILSGGLTGALNLAAAGQLEVADAANITATTLQQFGLQGDQASRVADVLAASANKAMGDVTDMSEALKYVGPVSAQMGLSLEETAGAIAELAQQGILGSQAGTSLRGMMTSLTSPSKQAALTMEGLGISMYDAQGEFVGLDGIAGQLHDTMGSLSNAERDQALGRIFGNEQITTARILYAGGSADDEKWTAAVTDSGFAAEQAATLTDNLAGDIEALKGSFETAIIGTGESSQGPLRGLVQNLTDVVNGYSGLPGPAKSATGAAIGLTAAIGGGTFVFAKAISGLAGMQTSLVNMGVSAERAATSTKVLGRVGVGAAGLGLLAAGLASTDKKMAALSTTAGGAALGFSVGGPWGAAIGGAIGLVVGLGKSHDDTAKKVATLTSSFDTQTGAITANTAAMVAKQLQDDGLLDTAEQFGVSTQIVTDAVLGQADAQTQLKAALDSVGYATTQTSLENLKTSFGDVGGAQIYAQQQAYSLRAGVEEQTTTFQKSADKAKQLAEAMNGTGEATAAAGTASYKTAEEVTASAKALADARKAAEDAARGFVNLGESVNDSKVSLGDWISQLEKQNQALRDFQRNAVKAADNGIRGGLIRALQDLGPEGALRLSQLATATDKEVGRANRAFGTGQKAVQRYADSLTAVPKSVSTTLTVQDQAAATIARIKGQLSSIPKSVRTDYYVNQINSANKRAANNADGGEIGGQRHPYGDKVLSWLAPGEQVISNRHGQADRFRADSAAGRIPAYADGGKTGAGTKSNPPKARSAAILPGDVEAGGYKGALRELNRDLHSLERQVKRATAATEAQSDAVDAATTAAQNQQQALDGLNSQFESLSSSIAGQFNSDLFGSGGSAFSGAGSDPISVLLGDIANSQQFQGLFAGLQSAGLSGGALTAAAQGGVAGLQTIAGYSPEQIAQFQQLFDIREQQGATTGQQVAQAQFGQAIADQSLLLQAANTYADQQTQALAIANAYLAQLNQQTAQTTHATEELTSSAKKGRRAKPRGRR